MTPRIHARVDVNKIEQGIEEIKIDDNFCKGSQQEEERSVMVKRKCTKRKVV